MAAVRKIPCKVLYVKNHGERVYTVGLAPLEKIPRFSAGQFLHLALDPYDPAVFWPESRVFSIASAPSRTEHLKILYSVKGKYTIRMERELEPDREVWIKLPYGDFLFDDLDSPRVLIAGGTGVSAFSALLKNVVESERKVPLVLLYGARNEKLLIFREDIETLIQKNLCERTVIFVEHGDKPQGLSGARTRVGFINLDVLEDGLLLDGYDYYMAGPPAMLASLEAGLIARQVPSEKIHIDRWE